MPTLFRNYTVVVQDSDSPYAPKNDLELLLYEGRVEIKPNPAAGGDNAVFQYGTTTLAVQVVDEDGSTVSAIIADATLRPGEYDFERLDLDGTTAGNLGTTLYSVVARPAADSALNSFQRAGIIVDRTDVSDPNVKQLVKASIGGTSSVSDNLAFAGGTVLFEQYTTGVTNSESVQYLKLTELPTTISSLIEVVSAVPTYADTTNKQKLIARFNVFYSSASGLEYIVWNEVPAYKMDDDSWVIRLQADEYNISRSSDFGGDPGDLDLGGIYTLFKVAVNYDVDNVHIRSFDNTPATTLPAVDSPKEKVAIHGFIDGSGNRIVGVGDWTYSSAANTPSYNLDVKGSVGVRAQLSSRTVVDVVSASSRFGYDTTQSYFGAAATSLIAQLSSLTKFSASAGIVYLGINTTVKPRVNLSSASVILESSDYTSLQLTTSEDILGYVKVGSSAIKMLSLTNTSQRIGYDVTGASPTYWGTSATVITGVLANVSKFYATTALTYFGRDTTAYPRINATAASIKQEASATAYWESVPSDGDHLRAYVDSKLAIDLDAQTDAGVPAPVSRFGYNIGTNYYIDFGVSTALLYNASTIKLGFDSTSFVLGYDVTALASPAARGTNTWVQLQGTGLIPTTYLRINSSNQWLGYMDVSGSAKKILSANETATVVRIGYDIGGTVDNYFGVVTTLLEGVLGGVRKFYADATATNIGFTNAASGYPRVRVTSSAALMFGASTTYLEAASAGTIKGIQSSVEKLVISSTESSLYWKNGTDQVYVAMSGGDNIWAYSNVGTATSYVNVDSGRVRVYIEDGTAGSYRVTVNNGTSDTGRILLTDTYLNIYKAPGASGGYTIFSSWNTAIASNYVDPDVISTGRITTNGQNTMFLKLPYIDKVAGVLPTETGFGIGTCVVYQVSGVFYLAVKTSISGSSTWGSIQIT